MYPTAYTLTVLVWTLLQYSFDKRYAKNACQLRDIQNGTFNPFVSCQQNVSRKEIRQLNRQELDSFIQIFNDYSTRNDTDELNESINEFGVVQIFDELLQSKQMLTPYWRYQLELENVESSAIWSASQFQSINQAGDAQWLTELLENENNIDEDEFFEDDTFSKLWRQRKEALKVIRKMKNTDVFWHLLLLVSIETGMDQDDSQINRTACVRDFGKFTRWINESCQVTLRDGEQCQSSGDCYNRRCSKNRCQTAKRPSPITILPATINLSPITERSTTVKPSPITMPSIRSVNLTTVKPITMPSIRSVNLTTSTTMTPITSTTSKTEEIEEGLNSDKSNEMNTTLESTESTQVLKQRYKFNLKPPISHLNEINETRWNPKTMSATTEFLANELTTPSTTATNMRKKKGKGKKRRKFGKKGPQTTVNPHDQIPPTSSYIIPTISMDENITLTQDENNSPIEPESYSTDTLDALLVYLPTPKVPTMISWTSKMPLRMAYFGFTIIEGSLGKQRRLKGKGDKRAKGARIYLKGLGMPTGYSQVTQGRQMKTGIGALARTLHPENNEPFVEFKMRVENRYGTPCKQFCLDSHNRYRRCARRTIRLSPYKKFSDPIPYFENESQAANGQFTGRGYYRKRKMSYLLFKCD